MRRRSKSRGQSVFGRPSSFFGDLARKVGGTWQGPSGGSHAFAPSERGKANLALETLESRELLSANVVINEIHYDPAVKTELVEFVELYNAGDQVADLSGWKLTDAVEYTFPAGTAIAPDAYLVVAENPEALQEKFGASSLGPYEGRLSSQGETVELLNAADELQDRVDYQLGFPWPTVGDEPGYSIELINPSLDNQLGGSWRASVGNQTVFDEGDTWKYFKGLSEPSNGTTAWRQVGFDDSGWETGVSPVGFASRVAVGTALSDMRNGYTSLYLRKAFHVDDPSAIGGLTLQALFDDGINVWINGTHVLRENLFTDELPYNAAANSSLSNTDFADFVLPDPSNYLVAGDNVISVQLFNQSVNNSDAYFDARLLNTSNRAPGPTPGFVNSIFADSAAPQLRQVEHTPNEPMSGEDVSITVKVTDPDGVASVTLDYQLVNPGDYITIDDPRYQTDWTTVVMHDDGTNGDAVAGDDFYTAVLPGELQMHRRLVRYRVTAADTLGNSITGPYDDDPVPNFAYFVYDGVPDWTGSWRPGTEPDVTYGSDLLNSVATYQLITTHENHVDAMYIPDSTARSGYGGADYLWEGTMVYDGEVYDHIRFRARGGVWRYAMGKNMWKFDFNRGHSFQARDDYGRKYDTTWDRLNFSALIQQGDYQHRGEQGLFESVGFKLFNLAGVESPNTNFVHFRIIESADENGSDQYSGDFQGLYMTIEQPDGRFLDEHGLPDANFYKIENDNIEGGNAANQGPYQVDDGSDVREFIRVTERTTPDEQWWRDNLDLDRYYSYQAVSEFIHHYDTAFGKNYYYYNNPETGKWQIHPWDLDLTWADNMFGDQNHDFNRKVADYQRGQSPFSKDYQNRVRDLVDLLYNEEQTGMLIDEMASFVYTPGEQSFVDADRAMWDYNPIIAEPSRYTNNSKNGVNWHYYQKAATKDFPGMIQIMKDYVVSRTERFLLGGRRPLVTTEVDVPTTPSATYAGPEGFPVNGLTFTSSDFTSSTGTTFAAMEWRIAEITDPNDSNYDPYDHDERRKYEINADWESGELAQFDNSITVPGDDLEVGRTYRVRVRMKDSAGIWSHWSEPIQFVTNPAAGIDAEDLRITEINYNPYAGPDGSPDNDEFEFIELTNVGAKDIGLGGIRFTNGIGFDFTGSAITSIAPGERVLVVKNQAAFESRYGSGMKIAGQYGGTDDDFKLSNSGEELTLVDGDGNTILQFTFGDGGDWPSRADGRGSTLELIDTAGTYSDPNNWRSSTEYGGSPGAAGMGEVVDVVINEVLTNTDPPQTDAIELYNTTSSPIDVSGWFLSDSRNDLTKFAIPAGTVIPARGYASFDESQFNVSSDPNGFALSGAHGDDVWLVSADARGNLLRFVDHVEFDAAANGVSFGRWPNGTGKLYAMDQLTLGGQNSRPRAGEVIISEIHYNPVDVDGPGPEEADDFEFIELFNRTDSTVDLTNWHLSGIDYTFPAGTTIAAGATSLLVRIDPAVPLDAGKFRFLMNVDSSVPLIGPYEGRLDNGGETLRLERPDQPPADEPDFIPMVLVDEVKYDDDAPWPLEADGLGQSLSRNSSIAVGDLVDSWTGSTPSPGVFDAFVRQAGDANEDGRFDQRDIVLVLQGGKYLTGAAANWAQGDWNGDGVFGQADIVAALQTGNYLQGPYAAEGDSSIPLRITELNYNPHAALTQFGEQDKDSDDYEFIELANMGTEAINLDGFRLTEVAVNGDREGVRFNFANQMLAPGEHIVIVKDREAFRSRFGSGIRIATGNDGSGGPDGSFGGKLSNNGEQLTLVDRNANVIQQFTYNDSGKWPGRADGGGSSLEVIDVNGDFNDGDNWRSSSEFGGSPGRAGLGPDNRIVINEVLAHTDPPQVDMVELFNTTGQPIDMSRWYLSDTESDLFKFQIPGPASVAAGGYFVLTENQFNFALSSYEGEDLWLIEADANGKPTRFVDRVGFGATANGVSVGRWPNGEGGMFPMSQLTLGGPNSGPLAGDVVFTEINYNPTVPNGVPPDQADNLEFIELHNRSVSSVDMTNWRINGGVEFTFAVGTLINPGETIVAVSFDPNNSALSDFFRTTYGIGTSVRLVGPYSGKLGNGGDDIRLEWPDEPPAVQPDFVPFILEDQVDYNDKAPWPTSADGNGNSLHRVTTESFGDFATSWEGQPPTPGIVGRPQPAPGDSNEDGRFDQKDIVKVLQAGKYQTGQPATFAEGDWNSDGVFNQLDIVLALQTGNYSAGAQGARAERSVDDVFAQLGSD